jgi:putative endonuclease
MGGNERDLSRRALGQYGETLVARWYQSHGYTLLDRNWRCREGELDLIVTRDRLLVFCEVKTRRSTAFGSPAEAVGWKKQRTIRAVAARWLAASQVRPAGIRFDVAGVLGRQVDVLEGAF